MLPNASEGKEDTTTGKKKLSVVAKKGRSIVRSGPAASIVGVGSSPRLEEEGTGSRTPLGTQVEGTSEGDMKANLLGNREVFEDADKAENSANEAERLVTSSQSTVNATSQSTVAAKEIGVSFKSITTEAPQAPVATPQEQDNFYDLVRQLVAEYEKMQAHVKHLTGETKMGSPPQTAPEAKRQVAREAVKHPPVHHGVLAVQGPEVQVQDSTERFQENNSSAVTHARTSRVSRAAKKNKVQSPWEKFQLAAWHFLEHPHGSWPSQIFHAFWGCMVGVSVCCAVLNDMFTDTHSRNTFLVIESIITALFTVEFVVKMSVAGPNRCRLVRSVYFYIDIIIIVQGYIAVCLKSDDKYLMLVKTLSPILRLLKLARTSPKWRLIVISLRRCAEPLSIPLFLLVVLVTFAGCLLYWTETTFPDCVVTARGDGCPDGRDSAFLSIPHAMWFVVVTISTVGYGDVYPKSDLGKVIGAFLIIAGVGYLAMPLAIVGGQFTYVWENRAILLASDKLKQNQMGLERIKKSFEEEHGDEDEEEDGRMSLDQFEKIMKSLNIGMRRKDIKVVFQAVDTDNSKLISFEEFVDFLAAS